MTPDPKFLYIGRKHEEAIATLTYGIDQSRGFIMLTGEVGSGKTTVLRHVFNKLEAGARTAMVLNPRMNPLELLTFINGDFGAPVKRNATHKALMDDLNVFLLECHREGRKAVLAIDEAQEMSVESLEFVRLLSNLETDTKKLIQIILVGQPELRNMVGSDRLRQLDQRIAVRYHLEPLDADETARYIRHRLMVAGSSTIDFPDSGVKAIHRISRGIPRLINLACDRVLLASFAHEELRVRTGRIKEALREFKKQDVATGANRGEKGWAAGLQAWWRAIDPKPEIFGIGALAVLALFIYGGIERDAITASSPPVEKAEAKADETEGRATSGTESAREGVLLKGGIYMSTAPALTEEASLKNLLNIWGEKGIDESTASELIASRGYALYSFDDMDKLAQFRMPAVLELNDPGTSRHVTIRWIVGGYAVLLDPVEGEQIVPLGWVRDRAVKARLLYRKDRLHGRPDEKSVLTLLSGDRTVPSLVP